MNFPSNRIDYKSVDEKENDTPLGRQNEESDFIRCVYEDVYFSQCGSYYALDLEDRTEEE